MNDQSFRERESRVDVAEEHRLTLVSASPADTSKSHESDLVDEAALAQRLGVSRATLQSWRYAGRGPTYIKVGRFIRYRNSDVEAFLDSNARAGSR
jgi:predicted DNA-binding transcriptional regulator AlpA